MRILVDGKLILEASVVSGGTIDGTVIGGITPSAGSFTDLNATAMDSTPIGGTTPAAGSFTTGIFSGIISLANNVWLRAKNYAGTDYINMFKVNVDDEIDVGGTIVLGSIEAAEDSGAIVLFDMPVSATPAAGVEESVSLKLDGNNILKIYAEADSAGGIQNERVEFSAPTVTPTKTPSAANDTGTAGEWAWDAAYIYICVATDTWERAAIASW